MAGTPNKRTQDLRERLEALGVDPLLGLAAIAQDTTASLELRAKVQCELMAYLYPKRRALDMSSTSQNPITISLGIGKKAVNSTTA